jgi:hypothetical protein
MSWRTITADDVLTRLAGPEMTSYRTKALGADQADPLPEIIAGVVAEVRNGIAQNPANRLAAGETVPPGALHHALAMVRYRLISRLPLEMKETRRLEYQDALTWLRSKPLVEAPEEEAAAQVAGSSPYVIERPRDFAREAQSGL